MEEKLEEMSVRFEELEHMLAQPDIIADQEKWQALAREHAHLSGIMEAYAGYKALAESVKEARELENGEDPELRELAASELAVNLPRLEAIRRITRMWFWSCVRARAARKRRFLPWI